MRSFSTGALLIDKVGLPCQKARSGSQGGDAQIAAMVTEGSVGVAINLVDPLTSHPHDPDIQTVLCVRNVHNVPIATKVAAADIFAASGLLAPHAPRVAVGSAR